MDHIGKAGIVADRHLDIGVVIDGEIADHWCGLIGSDLDVLKVGDIAEDDEMGFFKIFGLIIVAFVFEVGDGAIFTDAL